MTEEGERQQATGDSSAAQMQIAELLERSQVQREVRRLTGTQPESAGAQNLAITLRSHHFGVLRIP